MLGLRYHPSMATVKSQLVQLARLASSSYAIGYPALPQLEPYQQLVAPGSRVLEVSSHPENPGYDPLPKLLAMPSYP
jgi:hypothetical protein